MAETVDQKLLKATKFPPEFNQKVDMQKVNIEVIKKWIAGKISEIIGSEDDIVIELCFNLLEGSRYPNIKVLQIQLTGFLEKETASFCKELWTLCLSAQSNAQGVPKELLEAKKLELIQEKIEAERSAEAARKQRELERTSDRNIDDIRQRERGDRGRGRGGRGRGRGDGGRDFDRRPPPRRDSRSPPRRDSRSPPRRRGSDEYRAPPARRDVDTYVPAQGRRRQDRDRRPSPPRRRYSPSPSRSPKPVSTHRRRSPTASRSRSRSITPIRSKGGRRGSSPRGNPKRGDHREVDTRKKRPRSQSPRRRQHNSKRSPSHSSRSRSPPPRSPKRRRHASYSGSRSRSRSRSIPARSPSLGRSGRLNNSNRRSPSPNHRRPEDSRADVHKGQTRNRPSRRQFDTSQSRSRSRSAPPKDRHKRRQSMERFRSRRRRNTSSAEPEDRAGGGATVQGEDVTKQSMTTLERERALREQLVANRKAASATARS